MGSLADAGYIAVAFAILAFVLDPKAEGGFEAGGGKWDGPIWGILLMFGVFLIAVDKGFWFL